MESDSEEIALPLGIALAWGVAERPQRGPRRELSIEQIVRAAVELADAEGLGAVSMSAVAKRLGFTTMSLYRYVTNKDELLMVMGDAAQGLPPVPPDDPESSWRERLTSFYRQGLAVYEAHPWLLELPILGSPTTPRNAAWFDAGLATLDGTPLGWFEKTAVHLLVLGHSRWTAAVERGYATKAANDGVSMEDLDRIAEHILDTLVTAEDFPRLRRALDDGVLSAEADPFSFGLDRLLDGVATFITSRTEDAPALVSATASADDPADHIDDAAVRSARTARRLAEKDLRRAERQLDDAVKREREAVEHAREKQARGH